MYARIILPTDGSARSFDAVDVGIELASEYQIPIIGIYVLVKSEYGWLMKDGDRHDLKSDLRQYGAAALERIEKQCQEKGIPFESMLIKGVASDTIVSFANTDDLIIMSSTGKSGLERMLLGSVTDKIVHEAKASVLVVKGSS